MNGEIDVPIVWFWAGVFASFGLYLLALLFMLIVRRWYRARQNPAGHRSDDLLFDALQSQNKKLRQTEAIKSEKEAELLRLSEIHATLLAHIPIGVMMVDQQQQVLFTNAYLKSYFPTHDQQHYRTFCEATEHQQDGEHEFALTSGRTLTFRFERVALPSQKKLITLMDLTHTRELEHQLQLKRDLSMMGEIATGITHEVKNAIAVIQGHVQMLQIDPGEPEHLQSIQTEIRRLLSCVKALMQSAKNDTLQLTQMNLSAWFQQQEERWLQLPEGDCLRFFSPSQTLWIKGDPSMLTMLLDNLIRNALDAQANQNDPYVEITLAETSELARLTVRDDGPGFSADVQRKLFVPFVSTKKEGHGLGLFQCRKLVLQHGGKITLEPEKPTRIHCDFPLTREQES
jgi:signal transduction histidine kinase